MPYLVIVIDVTKGRLVDTAHHRAEMHRDAVRERDHLALAVEDRGRAVGALLDVG